MNELYHYGVKRRSGRYPWGSGEKPYQDEPNNFKNNAKNSSPSNTVDKKSLVEKGSARAVTEHINDLSEAEIKKAISRLNLNRQLYNLSEGEKKYYDRSYLNDIVDKVTKAGILVGGGVALYNTIASIYNLTPQGASKPLPFIRRG